MTTADSRDEEIRRLKAELEKANARAAYASPGEELERVNEMAKQAAEDNEDPWKIMVKIRVPRRPATEDPWYWININSQSAQIPANDKVQEMKLPYAITLLSMLAAEDTTKDFVDRIQVYDPLMNPKPV